MKNFSVPKWWNKLTNTNINLKQNKHTKWIHWVVDMYTLIVRSNVAGKPYYMIRNILLFYVYQSKHWRRTSNQNVYYRSAHYDVDYRFWLKNNFNNKNNTKILWNSTEQLKLKCKLSICDVKKRSFEIIELLNVESCRYI